MYKITLKEIKRNSYERAYNEGLKLYMNNIFPKNSIQVVDGPKGKNVKIYYGRCLDNIKVINVYIEVDDKDRIFAYYCNCPDVGHYIGGMCSHLTGLCFSIMKHFQDEDIELSSDDKKRIFEEQKNIETERKLKALEIRKRLLLEKTEKEFDILIKKYDLTDDTITLKDKLSIVPNIYLGNNKYLSLKVGIDKMYVVKNINSFLSQVYHNEFYTYGKKLSFYHKIDNFDEKGQKLIKILMAQSRYLSSDQYIVSSREQNINNVMLEKIFEIYKNDYVYLKKDYNYDYDYDKVYISSQPYHFQIELNDKGILKINDDDGYVSMINGYEKKYVIVKDVLYPVEFTQEDLYPLVEYLLLNDALDVNDVMEKFLSSLYPRIYEYISVSDDFKKEHPMSNLRIDSYFDFDNGVVELEYKYFIDEKEVSLSELMNYRFNNFKLEKYNRYIKGLGFEEIDTKYYISQTSQIVIFLKADLAPLKKFGDVYLSESLKRTSVQKIKKGYVSVKYDVDMLSVCFEDFDYTDEELYKLLNGYKNKKKFVKLHKDVIVEVDNEFLSKLKEVSDELHLDEKHLTKTKKVPLYQSLSLLSSEDDNLNFKVDEKIKDVVFEIKDYKNKDYPISPKIKADLRNYQKEAYNWLRILTKYKFGGVLADDMGLGKTLEMISLLASDEVNLPSLIVCPKSLMFNWASELVKWHSNLEGIVLYGLSSERKRLIESIDDNKKIYITSYDSLRNDIELYQQKHFRFVVLDEGQFIKNTMALKTKAVKMLDAEVRFVLTGTPIENSLSDLWSIFDFLMPGYLSTYNKFREKYETSIVLENDSERLNALVKKVTPFILRRTKKEVLKDLPEKYETVHYAFMEPAQRKAYESYLLKARNELDKETSKIQILSTLTRLRQLCVEPSLFLENYNGGSCKVELGMELIKDLISEDHRILIFSQFKSLFPKLINELDKLQIRYFVLTGDTPSDERMKMVEDFNNNEVIKVFLISLKAGGTGLNLIGADTVIHFDPWWNVSAENQATDRAHRLGQVNNVQVIKLICANSIEQKVIELQNVKKELTNKVISDNDENIIKLEKSDLKYLLS